ncbi:MAG: ABC transporter permease [Candidatus Sungbacteria bacterium]|nr:ABC transporter permease [Candidatus Sungbacteria bacterium]
MTRYEKWIAYSTIARKEITRFLRIWTQTLIPPVITSLLYYLIFGAFIGSQVSAIRGVTYMQFLVPGLVMMAVINNAYTNVSSSFFSSKFMKNYEEILVSPTPPWIIVAGYVTGGVARSVIVGLITLAIGLFFTHLSVYNITIIVAFILLTALLFSVAGLFNALFAKNFDDIGIIPIFVLTPLTYLGGVFYSIEALSPFWRTLSQFNPILYLINGFRYGFLGFSDVNVWISFGILIASTAIFTFTACYLFKRGYGLKS